MIHKDSILCSICSHSVPFADCMRVRAFRQQVDVQVGRVVTEEDESAVHDDAGGESVCVFVGDDEGELGVLGTVRGGGGVGKCQWSMICCIGACGPQLVEDDVPVFDKRPCLFDGSFGGRPRCPRSTRARGALVRGCVLRGCSCALETRHDSDVAFRCQQWKASQVEYVP
jgi:hypothetical protein